MKQNSWNIALGYLKKQINSCSLFRIKIFLVLVPNFFRFLYPIENCGTGITLNNLESHET